MESVLIATLDEVDLEPAPIDPRWVVSGNPQARGKIIARSRDEMATKAVWECTPGVFEWHYGDDETVYVIAGEAFLVSDDGTERRFGAGDMVFFPAGSRCTWRVTKTVRKFAVLRRDIPFAEGLAMRAVGLAMRATSKLVRMIVRGDAKPRSSNLLGA